MPDSRDRRTLIPITTLLVACSLGPSPAFAATCRGADVAAAAQSESSAEAAVACEINRERRSHGHATLERHGELARAGGGHAADMVRRSYFSHVSPGGQTLAERLRAVGYADGRWAAGEVLAWGTRARSTPGAIVDAWMRSPGHRQVLLNPRYHHVGIGFARGNPVRGDAGATYAAELGAKR